MSDRYDANDIIRLLLVLIGPVDAVADSRADAKRLENGKIMIDVVNWIMPQLYGAAMERHSQYDSARQIGENAYAAILELKKWCADVEEELA